MNIKEWRGLRAKRPVFVLLTPQETGEGKNWGGGARRRLAGGPWATAAAGSWGNRAGRRWGPIPPLDLRGGGP